MVKKQESCGWQPFGNTNEIKNKLWSDTLRIVAIGSDRRQKGY
jgi:hypothetical protein